MKKIRLVKNSSQEIREAFGLSQHDLAVFLGVSRSTISMAEGGRAHLPTRAMVQLGRLASSLHQSGKQPATISAKEAAAMAAALKKHRQHCEQKAALAQRKLTALQLQHQKCTTALLALQLLLREKEQPGKKAETERLWLQVQERRLQKNLQRCGPVRQALLQLKITALENEAAEILAMKW